MWRCYLGSNHESWWDESEDEGDDRVCEANLVGSILQKSGGWNVVTPTLEGLCVDGRTKTGSFGGSNHESHPK